MNVALVLVNRTFASTPREVIGRRNRILWRGLALVALAIAAIVAWPAARTFFGLAVPPAAHLAAACAGAIALLVGLEWAKVFWRRRLVS